MPGYNISDDIEAMLGQYSTDNLSNQVRVGEPSRVDRGELLRIEGLDDELRIADHLRVVSIRPVSLPTSAREAQVLESAPTLTSRRCQQR